MVIRRSIMVAACCFGLLAAMTPPAVSAAPAATVVTTVTPFAKNGQLRVKLGYSAMADMSSCDQSPVAKGKNVYQCGTVQDYLDACWPTPPEKHIRVMVCLQTPDDTSAVTWSFFPDPTWSAALPKVKPLKDPLAWQIVLDSGAKCLVRLGEPYIDTPAGYEATYRCPGAVTMLLAPEGSGTLNRSASHFTVQGVTKSGAVQTFGVKKVVYAGAAPKAATKSGSPGATCPARSALDKKIVAKYPRLHAIGKVSCVGKWARVGVTDGMSGGELLFKKIGGTWKMRSKNKLCLNKVGIPAAFAWVCYLG